MPKIKAIKAVLAEPIHPDGVKQLKNSGYKVEEIKNPSREKLLGHLSDCEVLICRTATSVDKELFDAAPKLKCVGLASTGYDRIDLKEASKRGIAVLGLPPHNHKINVRRDGNFISTAEHTMLLILATLGNLYQACDSLKAGRWEKYKMIGNEFYGKTLGIIGLGRIGKLVAERAKPFGVKIIAYDPYADKKQAKKLGVALVDLNTLCRQSDVITTHVRKNPETFNILNKKTLSLTKKGVVIINSSRADIVNEKDLIPFLRNGRVKAAGIDVFHNEPDGINKELIRIHNVVATPHIGGSTHEAFRRISLNTASNVIDYMSTGKSLNIINREVKK